MHRTLSAYVTGQIIPPFLVGLLAFTLVFLAGRITRLIELVVSRGAPLDQIAKLFALITPTLLETTMPMAFLLGILYGCGRLARDNETLAFKACGVGPVHFLIPVLLLGLAVSLLTLGLSILVRPAANLAVKKEIYAVAKNRAGSLLREKVFNDFFPKVLVYVDSIVPPGNTFQGILIIDQRDPAAEHLIIGRVALLHSDSDANAISLRLYDGMVHERRPDRSQFSQTSFNVYNLNLELEHLPALDDESGNPEEMSMGSLREAIRTKTAQGAGAIPEMMELHRRFAFPFAPLVFAVLGLAIVLAPNRSSAGRSHGVAACIAWLFAYYALFAVGTAMGENGKIPAALALWLPNLVVGCIAVWLFIRTLLDSPSPFSAGARLRGSGRVAAGRINWTGH